MRSGVRATSETGFQPRMAGLAVVVGFFLVGPLCVAAAAQQEVTIQVNPLDVSLSAGDTTDVVLVVSNGSSASLHGAEVSVVHDQELDVTMASSEVGDLPSKGSVALQATIATVEGARIGGEVHFLMTYRSGDNTPNVTTTTLTVEERPALPIQDLMQVTLQSSMTEVTDVQGGTIFVQVTNTSSDFVKILEVTGSAPAFIALCTDIGFPAQTPTEGCSDTEAPSIYPEDTSLAPRQSIVYPYQANPVPGNGFRVGKQLLLFKVRAQSASQNPSQPGAVFQTREVSVTVFGESIILTALSLASFFLLPGFLILVTIRVLWQYVYPKQQHELLKATNVDFWFLVIGLSILWLLLYPLITDLVGSKRDLVRGYTSTDIVIVWFAAVIIGLVFYGLFALIHRQESTVAGAGGDGAGGGGGGAAAGAGGDS